MPLPWLLRRATIGRFSATIVPIAQRASNSTKYWRINLLKLHNPETRQRYIDKVNRRFWLHIWLHVYPQLPRCLFSPFEARRALVDCMEMEFTTWITNAAKRRSDLRTYRLYQVPVGPRPQCRMITSMPVKNFAVFLDLSRPPLSSDHPIAVLSNVGDAVKIS